MASAARDFWIGFRAIFSGFRRLARLPKSYPFALVPALIFSVLEASFVALSLRGLSPWVHAALSGHNALQNFGAGALSWLSVAVGCVAGWFVAALFTPVLSAPALERIVALVEVDLSAPPRRALGTLGEFACGLRATALGIALFVPPVIALTVLELALPAVALVTTPVKLSLGALGVSWNLLDYPLTLRGIGARERVAFVRAHAASALGFGSAFALSFWLPCCGILLLPVGVAAATELYDTLTRTHPRTPALADPR
ncbi:MAG TPA: EI24 domain-containing protein [Polyangiaceae bacterium]|nr:EI24 domain-containing protein [Polyangiaceae bacterium]